ncbi:hepatoma-derived growth factor-related protein 3-like [Drosophila kikkawai]|uniref:Hepatoma-derived growth factor-related protein 3-like n=1 Tax=Drosophila kikkawai TaxID=30033 RepID=A0A6P4JPS7_DROKI|nr:hepatoma-derived growth factor-related protein 3-like [Drosophila kikkawai]
MGRNRAPRPTFQLGDFVFAKMQGYRPWPARVLGRCDTVSETKYNVLFYGTWDTAKVSPSHMFDFQTNKRRLGARRSRRTARTTDFGKAMTYAQQAFEGPEKDFVYYQVLARTEGDGECSVAYETSATESETDLEEEQVLPPANKPKKSMSLLDDQDDAPDQPQVTNVLEIELEQDNPVVGNEHLKDLEEQDNVEEQLDNIMKKEYDDPDLAFIVESNEDIDSDNDQPINLCCRRITGDEQ